MSLFNAPKPTLPAAARKAGATEIHRLEDLERNRTRARWADVARERMLAARPVEPEQAAEDLAA